MVYQERVGKIMTLVYELPGDCTLYFPETIYPRGRTKTYGDMTVTIVSEK